MRTPEIALVRVLKAEPVSRLAGVGALAATVALLLALDAFGAAIAAVASIGAVALVAGLSPIAAVAILLAWIALQNLAAPILFSVTGLGIDDIRGIIGTKELMAVSILAVLTIPAAISGRAKLVACDKIWLAYTAWVLLYALNPLSLRPELFYLAVSLRALLVPVLFYALGRIVGLADAHRAPRALSAAALAIAIPAAAFGILELAVLGDEFWRDLNIERYWVEVKGFSPSTIIDGLPANFYGQYGLVYELGRGTRRMASTYGDPLAAAYNLFFAALLCFAGFRYGESRFRASYVVGFALLATALALTISRVAMGALVVGCALLLVRERAFLGARGWLALATVGLALVVLFRGALAPAFVSAITMEDPSTRSHLLDLARGLQTLASPRALLGFGLGTAGAPAAASSVHIGITESAYLVLLAQVGIVGLVLFAAALISTYRFLIRHGKPLADAPPLIPALSAGLVGYALSAFVSEQIFTTTSLAVFWTLLGAGVSWCAARVSTARTET